MALSVAGCSSQSGDSGPATVAEAYRSAHPTGNLPSALATVSTDIDRIAGDLRREVSEGVPLVLPQPLPAGYGLAAPYIAVGSGAALPNPEVWQGGYRVSFTDGRTLVVVAVNLDDPPAVDTASPSSVSVRGRRLYEGMDGRALVLSSEAADDWQLTITGLGLSRPALARFAGTLRDVR